MKLLTQEIKLCLPPIGSQERHGNAAKVHCKFFHPSSNWTWYVLEASAILEGDEEPREVALTDVPDGADVADVQFYGLVSGLATELGYFSLRELESAKVRGLGVERDKYWQPRTLGAVRIALDRNGWC